MGAANAVLLKVNQVGTITEAFEMTRLAHRNGYGVMPCGSRGEGPEIVDYAVGLITGHMRGGAGGDAANRLLKIEQELGPRGRFAGKAGLKSNGVWVTGRGRPDRRPRARLVSVGR